MGRTHASTTKALYVCSSKRAITSGAEEVRNASDDVGQQDTISLLYLILPFNAQIIIYSNNNHML